MYPVLSTPWTEQVSAENPLPEYPRPQLVRQRWKCLNGWWEFTETTAESSPPHGETLHERVLVPFPVESELSGLARNVEHMFYRRIFEVPWQWHVGAGNSLLLHFGAVDHQAWVYVNGRRVATHAGGYDSFSVDITAALSATGPQEIIVGVTDHTDASWQPVGKQRRVPDHGIFYQCASGIWQTVWLEPVPHGHIDRLTTTPDIADETLDLLVHTGGDSSGLLMRARVLDGADVISETSGAVDTPVTLPVPEARLWSPESAYLYDLEVTLLDGGEPVDHVWSYFGMREVGTATDSAGILRTTLNGEPVFLLSTLDQGYWPDGIYTAPTDEALRFDLEQSKALGFNTVRKHVKVEPDRWYYHADRLGLLVWQDMPAMTTGTRPGVEAQRQFEAELHRLIAQHRSRTSIIGWVPFNEGWGEWSRAATARIAGEIKRADPTRLVNAHSGVNCPDSLGDSGAGDVVDWHAYVGPAVPPGERDRAAIDGEHGGFGLEVGGHMWFGEGHAYEMTSDHDELTRRYAENQKAVLAAASSEGISGAIYTQTTDVEHEINGLLTYDRRVSKTDLDTVRAANEAVVNVRHAFVERGHAAGAGPIRHNHGMTSADLLVDGFDRVREAVHEAVTDVSVDDLHTRLDSEANPIAWLIWHLTRVQDDHIADAALTEQVWTQQGWHERFGLSLPVGSTGFAHNNDEVAAVKVDSAETLTQYHDAVNEATQRYVRQLADADLDHILDYNWSPPVTLKVRLISVIADGLQHAGQAAFVRGILLRR